MTNANAASSRQGPSSPKPGMRSMIRSGRSLRSVSKTRPSWSKTRGVKFSMTTSQVAD